MFSELNEAFRSSNVVRGEIFRTINNRTNDLMDLAIFGGVGALPSPCNGLCQSWSSLSLEGLESRSSKGWSGRLAQGAGNAATSVSANVQSGY